MAHLKIQHRAAIANWRAYHEAGMHRKRKMYSYTYPDALVCRGKFGNLDTGHYIILNLLRELPASRGYNPEGEAFLAAVASLKLCAEKNVLDRYTTVFGMDGYQLKMLIQRSLM